MDVVHSGFDGLKLTIQTYIPTSFREALTEAKAKAVKANSGVVLEYGGIELTVRQTCGRAFSAHTGAYGAERRFLDPNCRIRNNRGVSVDFRFFLLATNRQLAIYDNRAEIIQTGKLGWCEIWNHTRVTKGLPRLNFDDRGSSQVWRFELRVGSKQLRNKWAIHGWEDLNLQVGDVFKHFCEHISYRTTSKDNNRSRWPRHELWENVTSVINNDLREMHSGVVPERVKTTNRNE